MLLVEPWSAILHTAQTKKITKKKREKKMKNKKKKNN